MLQPEYFIQPGDNNNVDEGNNNTEVIRSLDFFSSSKNRQTKNYNTLKYCFTLDF